MNCIETDIIPVFYIEDDVVLIESISDDVVFDPEIETDIKAPACAEVFVDNYLVTENGDNLVTENGDKIIWLGS